MEISREILAKTMHKMRLQLPFWKKYEAARDTRRFSYM